MKFTTMLMVSAKHLFQVRENIYINDQLKNFSQIEQIQDRSQICFIVHLLASLIVYTFQPKNPEPESVALKKTLMYI